jgi:hypothetical protein
VPATCDDKKMKAVVSKCTVSFKFKPGESKWGSREERPEHIALQSVILKFKAQRASKKAKTAASS